MLLLDWTENEKRQFEDGQVLPFSPVMRPSQTPSSQSNRNTFIDAYMKHLHQNSQTNQAVKSQMPTAPKIEKEKKLPKPNAKLPKPPRKPREPSVKKSRTKTDSNCTTIGLQIQIRDPNTEPATLETSYESEGTPYPYNADEIGTGLPSNVISNAVEHYTHVAPTINTATYYNLDSLENESGEQYLYEPEPVYHAQPMNIMPTEYVSPTTINSTSNGAMHTPLHAYTIPHVNYSDQKNNATLLSRFNVSHTNLTNNPVVYDPMHNWRAGNEIM